MELALSDLANITGRDTSAFSAETPLIGSCAEVKSRELVELLLAVEEFASEEPCGEFASNGHGDLPTETVVIAGSLRSGRAPYLSPTGLPFLVLGST